jgi:hypothetical protein
MAAFWLSLKLGCETNARNSLSNTVHIAKAWEIVHVHDATRRARTAAAATATATAGTAGGRAAGKREIVPEEIQLQLQAQRV